MSVQSDLIKPIQDISRGRWILGLLFVFFALPLLVVTLMYVLEWHPKGSSNGELISPPRLLQIPSDLKTAKGLSLQDADLRDKWSLVYVSAECAASCDRRLYTMRQLHASMAKNTNRLQRVLITETAITASLEQRYPDLIIINQPLSAMKSFVEQFSLNGQSAQISDRIYLVDPLGNLMMSYPNHIEPKAIRKDLTRLLAAAWAG